MIQYWQLKDQFGERVQIPTEKTRWQLTQTHQILSKIPGNSVQLVSDKNYV